MIKQLFTIGLLVFTFVNHAFSQETQKIKVHFECEYDEHNVKLRWAPSSYTDWVRSRKQGWMVQRAALHDTLPNGKFNFKAVVDSVIQVAPMPLWEKTADTSNIAAAGAELLFGETLDITLQSGTKNIFMKYKENQMRFSFALTIADRSFRVAQLMALAAHDYLATENKTYIYRIFLAPNSAGVVSDTAYKVVNQSNPTPMFKIVGVDHRVADTSVLLIWSKEIYKQYSFYDIQRSYDKETYTTLNQEPYVPLENNTFSEKYNHFADQFAQLGDTAYYRIRGITAFGTKGPFSDPIPVPVQPIIELPHTVSYSVVQGNEVCLVWEFAPRLERYIERFEVVLKQGLKETPVQTIPVGKELRKATIKSRYSEYYAQVSVVKNDGTKETGVPVFVQLQDSVPPKKPAKPLAVVDTTGHISIQWNPNSDIDIMGYKIYYSFSPDAEFSQLTPAFVKDTVYADSVRLDHLSPILYLQLKAYDYRFNHSVFSDVLEVVLPDTLPPSPPIMFKPMVKNKRVFFKWKPSESPDVDKQRIVAEDKRNGKRDTLMETTQTNLANWAYSPQERGTYNVWIEAEDATQNVARSVQNHSFVTFTLLFTALKPSLKAEADYTSGYIKLVWNLIPDVGKVLIYRKIDDAQYRLYKTLNTAEHYVDNHCTVGKRYYYRILFESKGGAHTQFSNEYTVNY